MTFTSFFIKHPVIAIILNAMIVVIGLVCFNSVPVQEYPAITVPSFQIRTNYPNASPELVETSVTNVLEDQLAGLEGLDIIESNSTQGNSSITLIFQEGTSIDRSLIAVQEAVSLVRSNLPKDVLEPTVRRQTQSEGLPFMAISLSGNKSPGELTHYATIHLKNALRSINGVSATEVWGQPYTMTITLDPLKLYAFGINVDEIYKKIENTNLSWPVGNFRNQIPTTMDLSLTSPSDFENMYLKDFNKNPVYLKSVADINLKTDDKRFRTRINGKPGLLISISRASDANPLEVSKLVHAQVENIQKSLPAGLSLEVVLDQASFIKASLDNIKNSIFEAIFLVLVIVFLFLRSFRATLIPLVTVPISIIGSVIFISMCGFSINTITLLAMVLAIGLVVDDAIVVLENISRHIEKGEKPLQAAIKGSREIGFAIVAMTLTLSSVYAPIAFIKGAVGQLFIEFAVALAGSVLISGIVALTLSPLMCSGFLQSKEKRLWPQIDVWFKKLESNYTKVLDYSLIHTKLVLSVSVSIVLGCWIFFTYLPHELVPKEDRGLMGVYLPPIPGKDINTLDAYTLPLEQELGNIPEGAGHLTFMGDWGASVCLNLKPIGSRSKSAAELVNELKPKVQLPSADAYVWSMDSGLPGIDTRDGSSLILGIATTGSYRDLYDQMEKIYKHVKDSDIFQSVWHDLSLDTPGYKIELDQNVVAKLGLSAFQISELIEVFFSGKKNLAFQMDNIRYPISLEGTDHPWTLDELYITTPKGQRVSLGTLAELKASASPKMLTHRNQMRSATLNVDLKPGQTLKESMKILWDMASKELHPDLKKEWIGAAKLYSKSSFAMLFLFVMALIFIYAILATQFESFIDPLIIMLSVPLACFGALMTAWMFGQTMNIYTQIGLVTLIGLISKHGILIVEFANQLRMAGKTIEEAVRESATLRLRPILMTTGAMVFGSLPLILYSGAGVESRRAIGFVLVGGLLMGTAFTLLILPKFYQLIKRYS